MFSCFQLSPDVLFWGLTVSPVACATFMEAKGYVNCNFRSQKYIKKICSCTIFSIFSHQNPGFGTGSGSVSGSAIRKNAGSGSAFNQCGSTILIILSLYFCLDACSSEKLSWRPVPRFYRCFVGVCRIFSKTSLSDYFSHLQANIRKWQH